MIASLILSVCLIFSLSFIPASAESFTGSDGITCSYSYDSGSNTLTVSGNAVPENNFSEDFPWSKYSETAEKLILSNGIRSIALGAFHDFTTLKIVELPNTLERIGSYAFSSCTALTYIKIPSTIESIEAFAFSGCTALKSITLPDKDLKIGGYAFESTGYYNNSSNWESGALYIGKHLIEAKNVSNLTVKSGTVTIAEMAFIATKIASVTVPDGVMRIGQGAFVNCHSLNEVKLPSSLKTIEEYAFLSCNNLRELVVPSSVNYIGEGAFDSCSNLTLKVKYGSYAHQYATGYGVNFAFDCAHKNSERRGAVAPTCTADGYSGDLYCFDCGGVVEESILLYASHRFGDRTIVKQPTCTETGIEKGKCVICNHETENKISKLGHQFSLWEVLSAVSCTVEGHEQRKCSRCGKIESISYEPYGHNYGEFAVIKSPTKTSTGVKERVCSNCGDKERQAIEKLSSSSSDKTPSTSSKVTVPNTESVMKNVKFSVEQVGADNGIYTIANNSLKDATGKFLLFEVVATLNGQKVNIGSQKSVNIGVNLPNGFSENVVIYSIESDGKKAQVKTEYNKSTKKLTATVNKVGYYALCDMSVNPVAAEPQNTQIDKKLTDKITQQSKDESKSLIEKNIIIFAVLGAVAIMTLITLIVVAVRQKIKNKKTEIE